MGANVFTNVNKSTCPLSVPAESIDAYKEADQWKDFVNIKEPISVYQSTNTAVNLRSMIIDKVAATPVERLHTVEEFAEKLEKAVLERL